MNLLRAFASGGMADLTKLHEWNLEFVRGTKEAEKYIELAAKITSSLEFMNACGMTPENTAQLRETEFYTCLLYTSPSPRDGLLSRMPSSA